LPDDGSKEIKVRFLDVLICIQSFLFIRTGKSLQIDKFNWQLVVLFLVYLLIHYHYDLICQNQHFILSWQCLLMSWNQKHN